MPIHQHRRVLRDNHLTNDQFKPAIHRLAIKAGITRLGSSAYAPICEAIAADLKLVIKHAVIIADKRKTITESDILHALELNHFKIYSTGQFLDKPCGVSHNNSLEKRMKEYQSQSGCYVIAKTPFERVVKEIAQDFAVDLRWSGVAMSLLQDFVEARFVKLFRLGLPIMLHAKRVTLEKEDIHLVVSTLKAYNSL